ncbi:hypothetical protein PZA11_003768 [Diplocarpon coronariae]|uniref:Uncharacterized protein n=1 Tax=Diplocarpon coronariae TaxID=2795749 RepID=A0A218ZF48_9HELO|nr:hypothetical protein JHW43_004346 [Diplocarpon mali]OWP06382.1 hypothetical protein B2J93_5335 [Marssonina coronariae]
MTSTALSEGALLQPKHSPESLINDERSLSYRHPTVYDAVAGRISLGGFISRRQVVASNRDTVSSSTSAISPENVLFRGKHAPTRYAESDIYFANEKLAIADLPESDLLKALHCYTSDMYSRAAADQGISDWRSMDESALLALGILMEEAALSSLGKTGDLALTEGEDAIESHPRMHDRVQEWRAEERPIKKRRVDTDG